MIDAEIKALLERHPRTALHFSGGKDSLACLHLLRAYLDRIAVYWVNTGDAMPETAALVERYRKDIPYFNEIRSDALAWREAHGDPSDLVPTSSSPLGRLMGFSKLKVADRFFCCWSNVMQPMHERMKADGVTAIIRGQKLSDMPSVPLRSGAVMDGFEFFFPLELWSDDDVFRYLAREGVDAHPCYEYGDTGVDCASCTGWWHETHFDFIRDHHPEIHAKVREKLAAIGREIAVPMKHFRRLDK